MKHFLFIIASMFTPIQQILPSTILAFGIKHEADAAVVCGKYRKLAASIIHPQALEYTYAKNFRNKTLTIGVEAPAWAQAVMEKKDELRNSINAELGRNYVNKIKTALVEKTKSAN